MLHVAQFLFLFMCFVCHLASNYITTGLQDLEPLKLYYYCNYYYYYYMLNVREYLTLSVCSSNKHHASVVNVMDKDLDMFAIPIIMLSA
jgi:hypothetical protein